MGAAKDNKSEEPSVTVLGPRDSLTGTLVVESDLIVHGKVDGQIVSGGTVTVEASGMVQASIEAENLTVRGEVRGDVVVKDRLRLTGNGSQEGSATLARLVVEEGGSINGSISMTTPTPSTNSSSRKPAAPRAEERENGAASDVWSQSEEVEDVSEEPSFS